MKIKRTITINESMDNCIIDYASMYNRSVSNMTEELIKLGLEQIEKKIIGVKQCVEEDQNQEEEETGEDPEELKGTAHQEGGTDFDK